MTLIPFHDRFMVPTPWGYSTPAVFRGDWQCSLVILMPGSRGG